MKLQLKKGKTLRESQIYSHCVVGDGPDEAHDGDQSVVAVASRLPVAVRREGDHLHRHFGHKDETET